MHQGHFITGFAPATAGFCKCLRLGFMAHRNHRPLLNSARLGLVLLHKVAEGIVALFITIVYLIKKSEELKVDVILCLYYFSLLFQVLEEIGMSESLRPLALPPEAVQTGNLLL